MKVPPIKFTDEQFLREMIARGAGAQEGYFHYAHLVACLLNKRLREQLRQLINGPVYDGNVICKTDRDELLHYGLAVRVCREGDQGYTGATYFAFSVMRAADDIAAGRVAA